MAFHVVWAARCASGSAYLMDMKRLLDVIARAISFIAIHVKADLTRTWPDHHV